MAQWVTVWRAAQLVGVPRGVLQQRVRAGEIELADGLVSTETLIRLYPQAELESSGMLERVAQIREDAFGRRVRERLLPSQEVLAQRLFRQSQELADVQRHLQRYHALVVALREQLRHLNAEAGGHEPRLLALQRQLNDGLARALATEPVDVLDVMDDMLKVVSAQVTLRPSGHQFSVEGRETLLQAGMRALVGVSLSDWYRLEFSYLGLHSWGDSAAVRYNADDGTGNPYRDFVEGNSWQYTFFVPHDVQGLIDRIGLDRFNDRLLRGFEKSRSAKFADAEVNHGNQPNMQAAWLFNYSRRPWETQRWAREIMDVYYGTTPENGYQGDEDEGQSAYGDLA